MKTIQRNIALLVSGWLLGCHTGMASTSWLVALFFGLGLTLLNGGAANASSPIIYYPLDEGGGQVAYDSSGSGCHATTTNSSPSWQPAGGIIGGGLSFGATSQKAVGEAFVYDAPLPLVYSHSFTLAAWIKTSQATNYPRACLFFGNGAAFASYYSVHVNEANHAQQVARNSGVGANNIYADALITDGQWHHLAAVFNDVGDRTLYVDGIARNTSTLDIPFVSPTERVGLGALTRSSPTDAYCGMLDDVGVWAETLPPEQVALIHALGLFEHIGLADPAIDALLAIYAARSGGAQAGAHTWTYTIGLPGDVGATGGSAVPGYAFVVLGADGSGLSTGMPWAILSQPTILTNGHVQMHLTGSPNTPFTIQYSSAVTGPWSPLAQLTTSAGGGFDFEDSTAPLPAARFYRAMFP